MNVVSFKMATHPEYTVWRDMVRRCRDPRVKKFAYYGGRGISVCEQWHSFWAFLLDMGNRPSTMHSIDRINTNGNYEPGNCRWVTQKEQCRNTRRNRHVTMNGETLCISEWCERLGMKRTVVQTRIFRGMTPEQALTIPILGVGKKHKHTT